MDLEIARDFLLWCTAINYGVLLVWFALFVTARDWLRRLHGRWFRLTDGQFDALHYAGMSVYKIGVLLFNRNKKWIPIMEKAMQKEKVFFAVGAGHLAGPQGVINLLRAKGYTVKGIGEMEIQSIK